jgi:hypothetical protein
MRLTFNQLANGAKGHLWLIARIYTLIVSYASKYSGISVSTVQKCTLSVLIILIAYITLY